MDIGLPPGLTWYKLLMDWGSIIGGVFALIAGAFAYWAGIIQARATRRAADAEIAVNARKDKLQAHCIAVGVYPELLAIRAAHERASAIISDEFPKNIALTRQIIDVIRRATIEEPPLRA